MKALVQRVLRASVTVEHQVVGAIGSGLLLFLGVEKTDDEARALKLLDKVLRYRIFADAQGRMNLSLLETGGSLLVVSQFTLVADTQKGLRPSFSSAAEPEQGRALYDFFVTRAQQLVDVKTGQFGADMGVELHNDGPVTFILQV